MSDVGRIVEMAHERTIGSKGHDLWGIPGAQLPAYIQHVYNDIVEGGAKPGGRTYQLAVGIVQNFAAGHDGHGNKVKPETVAKAVKAVAEWEALRARAKADNGKKLKEERRMDSQSLVGRISESWGPEARTAAVEARRRKAKKLLPGTKLSHKRYGEMTVSHAFDPKNGKLGLKDSKGGQYWMPAEHVGEDMESGDIRMRSSGMLSRGEIVAHLGQSDNQSSGMVGHVEHVPGIRSPVWRQNSGKLVPRSAATGTPVAPPMRDAEFAKKYAGKFHKLKAG